MVESIDHNLIRDGLCEIGLTVCHHLHKALRTQSIQERTAVIAQTHEDTIYQIDHDVEGLILPLLEKYAHAMGGLVLLAEGIGDEDRITLPRGMREEEAKVRILMDPIDGTRGIMYDKRSAFYLAGAAPNRMQDTTLGDIEVAVMVELPTSRSDLSDTLWAIRKQGVHRVIRNLQSGECRDDTIAPSQSKSILGGFAQISRFFPPGRELLMKIEEELVDRLCPQPTQGRALLFNEQYICTGGQLYEMLMGHDRLVCDLRSCLYKKRRREGQWVGMTCHPYDVSAHLIGEEAGLVITDEVGNPLDPPLKVHHDVDWIAYANEDIRKEVEPVLQDLLRKYGLI